ncbi:cellulose binding domain-containing protein [Actinoplanes sp. NPDC020271]|uniref:cellulose binding domain-containing protein n=1 Tax=Actinoplanes sp. NPDC020271 TaxID=3363896 RepID=UPI0037ADDB11
MSAPSKHRDRQFFLARGVFGLAALILVGLVVFIAVRSGGSASADENPVIVQPSADLQAAESTTVPLEASSAPGAVVPSVAPSASASASVSPTPSKPASAGPSKSSASPKPSKTSASPKPSASKSPEPPASVDLSVNCKTTSWNGGFITSVTVRNNGDQSHNFQVTIKYSANVRITSGPWNSSAVNSSGTQIGLRGNRPVDAHGAVMIGFQGDGSGSQGGCSVAVTAG